MLHIVYFHGLNTYGDELLHFGPVTFGEMHSAWSRAFKNRNLLFTSVPGLGFGPPHAQAMNAKHFLTQSGAVAQHHQLCFLGHSVGGLVARVLAAMPEYKSRVKCVATIGTPHFGTELANSAWSFKGRQPLLFHFARTCGYDVSRRGEIFSHYSPESMHDFNRRVPAQPGVEFSLLCDADLRAQCWPLRLVTKRAAGERGDGLITLASQSWGEIAGTFALDHISQMGYHFFLTRQARSRAENEFARLVATLAEDLFVR